MNRTFSYLKFSVGGLIFFLHQESIQIFAKTAFLPLVARQQIH